MLTNVYAEEPVDSVSIPFTSTICKTPTRLSWGFFLSDRACSPVFVAC